jgi:hypothetical protein
VLLVTAPAQERPWQQPGPAGQQAHGPAQPGLLLLMLDLLSLAGGLTGSSSSSSSRMLSLPGLVECGVHASWQLDMEAVTRTKGEAALWCCVVHALLAM